MTVLALENSRLRLEVAPEAGASIVSFSALRDGTAQPILRPTPADAIAANNSSAMSCFALVPYSNRLRDARFEFRGRTFVLRANTADGHAIHGDVRKRPWRLVEETATRLAFAFDSRDFGDVNFPFAFTSSLAYELAGDTLALSLSVTDADASAMPAGLGFHPYFRRALDRADDGVELRFAASGIHRDLLPTAAAVPLAPEEDYAAGRPLGDRAFDNCFAGWNGRAFLRWPSSGVTVAIEASDAFGHVILFAPPGKPFFALEPVSNANDGFNLLAHGVPGSGVRVLEPGETLAGVVRMRVAQT